MKKLLTIPFLTLIIFSLWGQNVSNEQPTSSLNGAYKLTKLKYGNDKDWVTADERLNIKVFKDGFWFAGQLQKGNTLFSGICGGTYNLKNGKYNEKIDFYSWDASAVGSTFILDYKANNNLFEQHGKMSSQKWQDYEINEVRERITAA